jgi:hypothetical protein
MIPPNFQLFKQQELLKELMEGRNHVQDGQTYRLHISIQA